MWEKYHEHFRQIVAPLFIDGADIKARESSGDLLLDIDWQLNTDPDRRSKRSKLIVLRISRVKMDEWRNGDGASKQAIEKQINHNTKQNLSGFNPDHDEPKGSLSPRVEWVV